jgi:hypothetical protein
MVFSFISYYYEQFRRADKFDIKGSFGEMVP